MTICWPPGCDHNYNHPGPSIYAGRCRSGRRWFWAATLLSGDYPWEHGWADTEKEAVATYRKAGERLARLDTRGREGVGCGSTNAGHAADRLKEVNAAKRRARPLSRSYV